MVSSSIYFYQIFCINLNAWNVHADVTTFAQVLVLVLVLVSEVLVLVLVLGEKSLLTSLVGRLGLFVENFRKTAVLYKIFLSPV